MSLSASCRLAGILGVGSYAPPQVVTNADLEARMDTSDDWIQSRTGIRERRIAAEDVATSDLAVNAALAALRDAQIEPDVIDLIIVATSTPDYPGSFPATAAIVQNAIGASTAAAFDLGAVCSGFCYALHVASQMVRSGVNRFVLVIGAEVLSRVTNWDDRNTAVLFGDGAGAVVVGEVLEGGYLGGLLGSDGAGAQLLKIQAGGTRQPLTESALANFDHKIFQNGREVYKFAVSIMGEAAAQAVANCGLTPAQVDLLIPHQANVRIIEKAAERMGLTMEKVYVNLGEYGNTSSASIPMALDEAAKAGRLQKGSVVVFVGFGAGLSWAANVIRWSK